MTTELAEQVTEVPRQYESGQKSTARLLKDAGFPELRGALSVEDVEQALAEDPGLAALWFKRGSDQRFAGGWGIECEGDEYRIRSFDGAGSVIVHDRLRACAEFVVRYVMFIGDVQARTR